MLALQASKPAPVAETAGWQAAIEEAVKGVVTIHFTHTAAFDTDRACASQATGVVVDAVNGYILTNRHVVSAGPFWGYCIFNKHEEVDVHAVYRDPIHDFGFLRFDPKAVKYMPLKQLDLCPDLAKVGAEIRVVGNDAGETLSILSGVISRVDRNVPIYGEGYNDFNTNYIQAAASATGGSSGSPVINVDGVAVALQAGGRSDGAATDFFLPLDRPLRALRCIQAGKPVTRGDIQTQFVIHTFDECKRLGLTSEWESEVRKAFPMETGMLVADIVLPDGPAHGQLKEGDILVKINGELLTQFSRFDEILDENVSKKVKVLVQRGGIDEHLVVTVGDLHAITPDRYVNVAGAFFHDLSYQQARSYAISLKNAGAYCCKTSVSFDLGHTGYGWLIQAVDGQPTPTLQAFIDVMKEIPDRSKVVVKTKHLGNMHTLETVIVHVDRHWHECFCLAVRNDKSGLWDFYNLAPPIAPRPPTVQRAICMQFTGPQHKAASSVISAFVKVCTSLPMNIDGDPRSGATGYGLVVDAKLGLVLVSRAIVPHDMCDITITIADRISVEGEVIFQHPLQNYAILKYNPSRVQVKIESARLASESIKHGESTTFVGFNHDPTPAIARTTVTNIATVAISSTAARYRAVHLDSITVDTSLGDQCGSGVLVRDDGTVQALWMTYLCESDIYYLGSDASILRPVIDVIKTGRIPSLRTLDVDWKTVRMENARVLGASEEWMDRVQREDTECHQLLMVHKVDAGHDGGLVGGDLILTLNGKLVTRMSGLNVMDDTPELKAVIIRQQKEMELTISTAPASELQTNRVVKFCGAILQRPHQAVRQQISKLHSGVYINGRLPGSPASLYGLAPTNFIMAIGDVPTPDLESFVTEANKIPDKTDFRVKLTTFNNVPCVVTLKKNEHYFSMIQYIKDGNGRKSWRRIEHEDGKTQGNEGGFLKHLQITNGTYMV